MAFVEKYFKKGDGALVRGRLESRKYTAKDGTNRTVWGITVEEIDFPAGKRGEAKQTEPQFTDVPEADIPF